MSDSIDPWCENAEQHTGDSKFDDNFADSMIKLPDSEEYISTLGNPSIIYII